MFVFLFLIVGAVFSQEVSASWLGDFFSKIFHKQKIVINQPKIYINTQGVKNTYQRFILIKPLKICSKEESRGLDEIESFRGISMLPTLSEKDRIFVNGSIQPKYGDIIWFDSYNYNKKIGTTNLVHRIVGITTINHISYYTTQGDNRKSNPYPEARKSLKVDIKGVIVCKN